MRDLFVEKTRVAYRKDRIVFGFFMLIAFALFAGQAMAIEIELFGTPLSIKGYANQSVQFGVAGNKYDTRSGFQQGLMQALVEMEYRPEDNLKFFVSGMLSKDWAYNILVDDDDWKERRFDESRSEMSLRNDYEDMLKECHATWSPSGFNIRVGKQIVAWGRMDGVRLMDQINPIDRRLGPSDVEFESTIIPIWLAKMEYYPGYKPPFLDELGLEFTFNPNADFIPSKVPGPGNYVHGIWAADQINSGIRIGPFIDDFDKNAPDKWNDGHEYAIRMSGTLPDSTFFTLNFFKGVDDSPVFMPDFSKGGIKLTGKYDDEGRPIGEPYMTGYYPDKKFAGFTFDKDINALYVEGLGGVAPLIRCEALYEFDSAFTLGDNANATAYEFEKHDAIFWGFGIDWKFKWNLLNPRRYFSLVPQFTMRHIRDYPSDDKYLMDPGGQTVSEDWYSVLVRLSTQYLHDKLEPMIIWQRDVHQDVQHKIDNGSVKYDLWIFRLNYQPNHIWTYKAQLMLWNNDGTRLYRGMDHKDNISLTVQYQF